MSFTEAQINRYARHILLEEVGGEGQEKLLDSRVLVVGAGGLGSPVLLYLAAAGGGTLGIVDELAAGDLRAEALRRSADLRLQGFESGEGDKADLQAAAGSARRQHPRGWWSVRTRNSQGRKGCRS